MIYIIGEHVCMYVFLIILTAILCFIFLIMFLIEHYLSKVIDSDLIEVEDEEDNFDKEKS